MIKAISGRMNLSSIGIGALLALFLTVLIGISVPSARAATPLTGQMEFGSRGANVSALQTLLATNSSIYPAGIVSGYYGPLTRTAVTQFQIAYNISPVGRVGPITLAKINQLIANNVTSIDINAPFITNVSVATSSTSATINWRTSEFAFGKVHYDVNPITMIESSMSMVEPQTSGIVLAEQSGTITHSLMLNNLTRGRIYYYSIASADPTGNLSVTRPSSFLLP